MTARRADAPLCPARGALRRGRCAGAYDDDVILEIAGATLHYAAFNTISHGMMLDAPHRDLAAVDFQRRDRTE